MHRAPEKKEREKKSKPSQPVFPNMATSLLAPNLQT